MLAAVQSLYTDAQIVVNISGCIGDRQMPVSGVKKACPLSPTLFRVFIDALEGWLSHRAAAALPGSPFSVRMVAAACSRA